MQRPQSLGGISAGMEFSKVNSFQRGSEGKKERGKKIRRRRSSNTFFFFFPSEKPCLGFTEGKATEDCWGGLWCSPGEDMSHKGSTEKGVFLPALLARYLEKRFLHIDPVES